MSEEEEEVEAEEWTCTTLQTTKSQDEGLSSLLQDPPAIAASSQYDDDSTIIVSVNTPVHQVDMQPENLLLTLSKTSPLVEEGGGTEDSLVLNLGTQFSRAQVSPCGRYVALYNPMGPAEIHLLQIDSDNLEDPTHLAAKLDPMPAHHGDTDEEPPRMMNCITYVYFSPNASHLLTLMGMNGLYKFCIWNLSSQKLVRRISLGMHFPSSLASTVLWITNDSILWQSETNHNLLLVQNVTDPTKTGSKATIIAELDDDLTFDRLSINPVNPEILAWSATTLEDTVKEEASSHQQQSPKLLDISSELLPSRMISTKERQIGILKLDGSNHIDVLFQEQATTSRLRPDDDSSPSMFWTPDGRHLLLDANHATSLQAFPVDWTSTDTAIPEEEFAVDAFLAKVNQVLWQENLLLYRFVLSSSSSDRGGGLPSLWMQCTSTSTDNTPTITSKLIQCKR